VTTTGSLVRAQGVQRRPALKGGEVLDGRWRIERFEGVDSAGQRYTAVEIRSGQPAQVLLGDRPLAWDAAWLDHPQALRALSSGIHDGHHFLVQEAGKGRCLSRWDGTPVPLTTLLSQAVGIADALDCLHHETGAAHGRLGLHSLWQSDSGQIRLCDLAFSGSTGGDPSEDQYALASLLHLLATGHSAETSIDAGLPRGLEQLLRIALSEHASWRFPTMRGMKRALERALIESGGVVIDEADATTLKDHPIEARVPPPSAFRTVPLDGLAELDEDEDDDDAPGVWPLAAVASVAAGIGFGLTVFGGLAVVAILVVVLAMATTSTTGPVPGPTTPVASAPVASAPVAAASTAAAVAPTASPVMAPGTPDWTEAPVSFAYDSWEIQPTPAFARFAREVRDYPGTVLLTGHTDTRGSAEANQTMGLGRAWAVEVGLLAYDVDDDKVEISSAGETQPITRGTTAADHARNRRVTVGWQ
jgi:outer membrane protein OmpA-like peptidoglycan-associated protein